MSFFNSIYPAKRAERLRQKAEEERRKLEISQEGPDARIKANHNYTDDIGSIIEPMCEKLTQMVSTRYNSGLDVNGAYEDIRDNTEEGENGPLAVPRDLEYYLQDLIARTLNVDVACVEVHAVKGKNGLLGRGLSAYCMVATVNLTIPGDLRDYAY